MNEIVTLMSDGYVKVENSIYFCATDVNCVYKLNLETGETILVSYIPEESSYAGRLSAKILKNNNKLYFIPYHAKKLWVLNLEDMLWKGIDILPEEKKNYEMKFYEAFIFQRKLYMIGCFLPILLIVDIDNYSICYEYKIHEYFIKKQEKINDCYFKSQYVKKDNSIYLASCLSNEVVIYNLLTREIVIEDVGKKNNRYAGIIYDGENYWLAPRKSTNIVKWDGAEDIQEFELPESEKNDNGWIQGVIKEKDALVFPGLGGKRTIIMDKDYNISVADEEYWMAVQDEEESFNLFYKLDGSVIYETSDGTVKEYKTRCSRKKLDDFLKSNLEGMKKYFQNTVNERENVGIKEMINFLFG